jgi:hypothetical protein
LNKNYELIEHEIEKKEKKKIKLNEDIQKMQKELDELNKEIDKYKSLNLETFNILHNNKSNHKGKDKIKNIKNNKYEEKKVDLFSFNQDLDIPNSLISKFNEETILQTMIANNENKNPNDEPKCVNTSFVFKTLEKHKFLNVETINNNKHEGFDQYSFSLTNNLYYRIKEGTKEASIKIELENDGKFCWPKNETFLIITDEAKSQIKSQRISLLPLIPKDKCLVNIQLNVDKLKKGIYKKYLVFNAKNENFGNNIKINIEIY